MRFRIIVSLGDFSLDVDLQCDAKTLVLIGPNGAGKTTFVMSLLGIIKDIRGALNIGDTVLFNSGAQMQVPVEQRRLGYVPQDYALFPHLDVRDNIKFAVKSALTHLSRIEVETQTEQSLFEMGISHLADKKVDRLSGGQKQRVAIARALSIKPLALILDEPFAALDTQARDEVRSYLRNKLAVLDLPTILITHDPVDARFFNQQIAVLEAGRITTVGTWNELKEKPKSDFLKNFTMMS